MRLRDVTQSMINEFLANGQELLITPETWAELQEEGLVQRLLDNGVPVKVISQDEIAVDDNIVVMCLYASNPPMFPTNVDEPCADCGIKITHRPHYPKHAIFKCQSCVSPAAKAALAEAVNEALFSHLAATFRNGKGLFN